MIEIRRATNPGIIKYLRPLFIEDGAFTRDIIAKELFEIMIATPSEIFVVVIFEKSEIYGFVVGYLPDNREYIWLAQAWSKPGTDREYGRKAIKMIKRWAVNEYNIHEIRFETNRNPKVIERAWGFKIHAVIMKDNF